MLFNMNNFLGVFITTALCQTYSRQCVSENVKHHKDENKKSIIFQLKTTQSDYKCLLRN